MISGVIITYNEEEKIADAILSLQSVCNEVIIVDAESTDKTWSIAQKLGARVYVKKWEGYGQARNYGASQTNNDWILALDADEQLDIRAGRFPSAENLDPDFCYQFKFRTLLNDKAISFGPYYNQWRSRLYNRNYVKWDEPPVHESLIRIDGTINKNKKTKIEVVHRSFGTLSELEHKLLKYAKLSAQPISKSSLPRVKFYYHFIRNYIVRLGFLDGVLGWKLSIIYAHYHRKKYL